MLRILELMLPDAVGIKAFKACEVGATSAALIQLIHVAPISDLRDVLAGATRLTHPFLSQIRRGLKTLTRGTGRRSLTPFCR
jgi:hypothetical protein